MVTFIITVGDLYEKKFSSAPPLTAGGPISCFLAVFLVNFGAHVLVHLGCSKYYFCIYGIYEEFSRTQIFFLVKFSFLGPGEGSKVGTKPKFLNFFLFFNFFEFCHFEPGKAIIIFLFHHTHPYPWWAIIFFFL